MGVGVDNREIGFHSEGGQTIQCVVVRCHHELLGQDTHKGCTLAAWRPLRDAILQQQPDSAIDALGVAAFGQWWSAEVVVRAAGRLALYQAVRDACL